MKKKSIAAFFAFPFGVFGLHRFYLGQRLLGILYLSSFIWGVYMAAEIWWIDFPFVLIPVLISFVDAMLFWAMPQEDFDAKFNLKHEYAHSRNFVKRTRKPRRFSRPSKKNLFYKSEGILKFRDYDYEGAVEDFKLSLGVKYDDPATHFNLACCYSYMENPESAFFHLSKSVEFGFVDFEKIYKHDALAFLRIQPEFEIFVKNGYRQTHLLPEPETDLLHELPPLKEKAEDNKEEDLLDQIIKLGNLRDKGILTEEEFILQKKKILES